MKVFLGYLFCGLYILCAGFCGCNEDDFSYVDLKSETGNVVFFGETATAPNKTRYQKNEILWVNIAIPNTVKVDGEDYDIYENLGSEAVFSDVQLAKKGAFANPSKISFSPSELVLDKGNVEINGYDKTSINCELIRENNGYGLRFGIRLLEKGDFILTQNIESLEPFWNFYLYDDKIEDDVFENLTITSGIANGTENGFEFTVE